MKYYSPITDYVVRSNGEYVYEDTTDGNKLKNRNTGNVCHYVYEDTSDGNKLKNRNTNLQCDYIQKSIYKKTIFFPVINSTNAYTTLGAGLFVTGDYVYIPFMIPREFNTIVYAKFITRATTTGNKNLTLHWIFSTQLESYTTHTATISNYGVGNYLNNNRTYVHMHTDFTSNLNLLDQGVVRINKEDATDNFEGYIYGLLIKFTVEGNN